MTDDLAVTQNYNQLANSEDNLRRPHKVLSRDVGLACHSAVVETSDGLFRETVETICVLAECRSNCLCKVDHSPKVGAYTFDIAITSKGWMASQRL